MSRKHTLPTLIALLALHLVPLAAAAQSELFLCSDALRGEVTDKQFLGCVELSAIGESIEAALIDPTTGKVAPAFLGPLQLVKPFDRSSIALRREALFGRGFDASIYFRQVGQLVPFLAMEVRGTRVVGLSMSGIGEDGRPLERVELVPRSVTWRYEEVGKEGSSVGGDEFSYDFDG